MSDLAPYYLVGVTAVGKSSVAQFLALQDGFDILSADSMLVYEGMNIGTAKPSEAERGSVRYYGVDLVEPDSPFSVWEYVEYVQSVIDKLGDCIVAGGTGLYVQSLLGGLAQMPGANEALRSHWQEVMENDGIEALQAHLKSNHPKAYDAVEDKKNVRRLIRALEIAEGGVSEPEKGWKHAGIRIPGLLMPQDELNKRIEVRVDKMFKDGLVEEVEGLLEEYDALSPTAAQAIGYSETIAMINGECTLDEAKQKTATRTRRLAKRQMTWFRNQMEIDWIEISSGLEVSKIAGLVSEYWRNNGPAHINTG